MKPAIRVEGLSKMYQIGAGPRAEYGTLRETVMDVLAAPWRRLRELSRSSYGGNGNPASNSDLWALKDVSFEVRPGEVLGVIGRNGAGKSTLLKILSRITLPTSGRAELHGRVGSLLEVGTGFHPELTGRENVYLNGAILGMTRGEIDRKFDEIVAFAEIDRFLDTPVKRYSSGMYMRLAFAVASHLEPEILLVDEVLAVGDVTFQRKCLGKMNEVSRAGRTVLFVSHNMGAIKSLCSRAILVAGGRIAKSGNVDEVVDAYLDSGSDMSKTGLIPESAQRQTNGEARLLSVQILDDQGRVLPQVYFGQELRVRFVRDILKDIPDGVFEVSFSALDGTHVACAMTIDGGGAPMELRKGRHVIEARLENHLLPRQYSIDLGIHHYRDGETADYVQRTYDFAVLKVAESGNDHFHWAMVRGYVRARGEWQLQSREP